MPSDRFLIVTGMSGSGKTSASRVLEDFGYYCVDNLPAKLIPDFVELWRRKEVLIEKVALTVDIRESGFAAQFPRVLSSIKKKINPTVVFLDSSDETLIKRFSESRRPHPLKNGMSIRESVNEERRRLAPIKKLADDVIDTSSIGVAELKKKIAVRFGKRAVQKMKVAVVSFGYKYGIPLDSDLVFDTRFLPNPFYIDSMRSKTGRSKVVSSYILKHAESNEFIRHLFLFMDYLMPRFIEEGKSYLTVSIGCTGGKHRSVVMTEELKRHLKEKKFSVKLYHRDILK